MRITVCAVPMTPANNITAHIAARTLNMVSPGFAPLGISESEPEARLWSSMGSVYWQNVQ